MDVESQTIIIGIVSFILLVFASWCVGEGGEILGERYDASVIGGLIIAWLNTAPEAIFFVTALQAEHPRFAVGAVSGSSIVVCTVALGACVYIGSKARNPSYIQLQPAVKKQCLILLGSTCVPLIIAVYGFNWPAAILGVVYYTAFLLYSILGSSDSDESVASHTVTADAGQLKKQDLEAGDLVEELDDDEDDGHHEPVWKGAAYLVVGGGLIMLTSGPFINAVSDTAVALHVNPILLAFFLAPIASEAPEILESISLSRKGKSTSINVAFSNLVGGTITKTTLLCGVFCFFGIRKEFDWEYPSYPISLGLLVLCAAASASIGFWVKRPNANHGIALFLLFVFTGCVQYYINGNLPYVPE